MKRQRDRERGASLVEFALVLPVFMALVLGMFTGGIAYNRDISLTNAAREASRYGATLPVSNFTSPPAALTQWLDAVADIAEQNASGDIDPGTAERQICVAYVHPAGGAAATSDQTHRLVRTDSAPVYTVGADCFSDGRPANERRVQVRLQRTSTLEALVFSWPLPLSSSSFTRFEAIP